MRARRDNDAERMKRPEVHAKEKERCWAKYGIVGFSYKSYLQMFEDQKGRCAVCDREIKLKSKKKIEVANVDHDHDIGKVRSLLCNPCNKMLGCGETAEVLRKGAAYLERHSRGDS